MTLTLTDALLAVLTAVVVAAGVVLLRLAGQLQRAALQWEEVARNLNHLAPKLEATLEDARRALARLEEAGGEGRRVLEDLAEMSRRTRDGLLPLLDQAALLGQSARHVGALLAGAKAGWGALRRARRATR
jgi:ABC-type transporter Mla subunit MlaD